MSVIVDVAVAFIEPMLEALGVDSKDIPCERKRQIWTVTICVVLLAVAGISGTRWFYRR